MKSANSHALHPANSLTTLTNRAATLLALSAFSAGKHSPRPAHSTSNDGALPSFQLFEADSSNRADIEEFIRRCYAENFNAQVDAFMPRLFGLRDSDGAICGAFGMRTAARRLFLEQYLQTDIEAALAHHCGRAIDRHSIVEVGHFSGSFPGAAREMIRQLTLHLRNENYAWVTFTGTSALRNAFGRMGLNLIDIAPADIDRLPADARSCWGNYYDHAPRVMAGEVCTGYEKIIQMQSLPGEKAERCA